MSDAVPPAELPPIDVAAERRRTPGAAHGHHLNAAGAALASEAVLDTVIRHLRLEARMGGYEAAAAVRPRIEGVYAQAAALLNARAEDIAQVESATVAWQRAIDALHLAPGDRVLVGRSSYVSSALNLLELERVRGIEIEIVPSDDGGRIDLERLEAALRRPAALVTVSHVPTSSGLVEPVAEVGLLARAAGVPYLLDATQSVGQLPVDVERIACDLLFTTGRKFLRGPRGTGLLYVAPGIRDRLRPPAPDVRGAVWTAERAFDLHPTAWRFETWEASHALRLGMGVALAEALALGVPAVSAHIERLGRLLRERLAEIPRVRVVDPPAAGGGIVTFVRDGEDPRVTQSRLQERGLRVVVVPASHGQWDLGHRGVEAVVRASFHVYNDVDDIDALEEALRGGAPVAAGRRVVATPVGPDGMAQRAAAPDDENEAPRHAWALRTPRHAEVVVVGDGVHGAATALQLARRGVDVVSLERFRPGHQEGSSHGRTRMIRRAYPAPVWDGFVDRAYAAWSALQADADVPLVNVFGGLYARPSSLGGALRGPGCEPVDVEQAAARFPGLRLEPGFDVIHDPAAGVIDAAAAMRTLRGAGDRAGVERREAAPVLDWEADGEGFVLHTPAGRVLADRVVFCAGPWTGRLLPEFAALLRVIRIVTINVAATDPARTAPPQLGLFSVDVPDVGLLFGLPAFDGDGLKVGLDEGPDDDLDAPRRPVTPAEVERLHALARRFVPGADGGVVDAIACRYTMAPRNRFAIGPVPERPGVFVGAACSGHAFKFGPAVGEALADLVTGVPRPDVAFLDPSAMLAGEVVAAD
ncbi:aminotransferase class V-fold PLP-dependent enzyme [Patulibacter defluvii]|uniref:aminotransferase class V-fold PLP-dependent enzyme n=1 Tax=Patulibacter defluvii TaxID=3095358 RepID=UPI002A75195D|nr:aminotransferase class V-fold PLP-dependent enzyme [Patulibacter sp. DM4]